MLTANTQQQPLAAKKKGTGLPTYTVPGVPGPTDTSLTLTGTFADQQTAADTAYQNALAQLAQQRQSFYSDEGFNQDGTIANNPLSAYGQLSNQLAGASNTMDSNLHQRGLFNGRQAHGIGAQQEEAQALANGQAQQSFLSNFLSGADNLTNAGTAATQAHTDASNSAKQGMIDYLIQNGQHVNAAGNLSSDQVKARVAKMAAAWMKRWGGGANSKNLKGVTFEDYLTKLGSRLYDPSAHYSVGKVKY